jgi:predicted permease
MTFSFDINILLGTVVTMFLILVVGFAARKLGFIDDNGSKFMSNLIIYIAQPFMLIGSVVSISYSVENLKTGAFIIGFGIIIHAVAAVIAYTATFRVKNVDERRIMEYGMVFANCGFFGFPILQSMFSDLGLFQGSFYVIVFNLSSWTYGMVILSKARAAAKINLVKIFLNFGTTPCLIGLILFILRVKIPAPVTSLMTYLGSLCTPLSMLIVGGLLATIPFKTLFGKLKIYYVSFIRLIAVPLVVMLLCKLVGIDPAMAMFGTVMASLPTASNTVMFAEHFNLVPDTAAHAVGIATLLSSVTIPLVVFITTLVY